MLAILNLWSKTDYQEEQSQHENGTGRGFGNRGDTFSWLVHWDTIANFAAH